MHKRGKKSTYIDSNNYLAETQEDNFNSDSTYYEIPDSIRYYSKNYWTVANGNTPVLASQVDNKNALFVVEQTEDPEVITLVANKQKFTNRIINERGILEDKFDEKKWEQFLSDIIPDKNTFFQDYYIDFEEPINLANDTTAEPSLNYINREFKYGFYSQKYENLANNRTLDVGSLPNIFSLLNDKNLDTRTYEENLVLSLGGLISSNLVDSLFLATDYNENVKRYFEVYSDTYNTVEARTAVNQIIIDNFKIDLYKEKINLLRDVKFAPFPYYFDIKFSNDAYAKENLINKMNEIGKTSSDLLRHLKNTTENLSSRKYVNIANVVAEKTLNEYDFKLWLDRELTGSLNVGTADSVRIYDEHSRIYSQIEYTNLMEYVKTNIKPKVRKYSEYTNTPSEYHVLFYKIEKKQFGKNTTPVQTFWVTPDDGEFIRFIDTQVKYGLEYFYVVSAYVFVVGNRYSYDQSVYTDGMDRLEDLLNGRYKIKINNKSSYKILELGIADISGIIHEFPYTKPQVKLEKDGDNILVNIRDSAASSVEKFEIIENRDFNLFESIRLSQDNIEQDKIESRNHPDIPVGLQIYKTTVKPTNYLGFQGKLYKTLIIDSQKSFLDTLSPNTKYYYMFRYLNNHNTPSNVSAIYEVEMKNEDGYSYLNVNTLDLHQTVQKSYYKDMKRYLLIRPSVIQTQPKTARYVDSVEEVSLGPAEGNVWDKDFILRITSKKTNRILEFNLRSIINRKKE